MVVQNHIFKQVLATNTNLNKLMLIFKVREIKALRTYAPKLEIKRSFSQRAGDRLRGRKIKKSKTKLELRREQNFNPLVYHYVDHFLDSLVGILSTCLASPEENVVEQSSDSDAMYFIMTGDCIVNQVDENRIYRIAVSLLSEGSFFGEIGVLFKSKRTASVISRNYNTMAFLSKQGLRGQI